MLEPQGQLYNTHQTCHFLRRRTAYAMQHSKHSEHVMQHRERPSRACIHQAMMPGKCPKLISSRDSATRPKDSNRDACHKHMHMCRMRHGGITQGVPANSYNMAGVRRVHDLSAAKMDS